VIGPYICFEDIDSKTDDGNNRIQNLLQQKFILQRAFFEDSTKKVNPRAVLESYTFSSNIINTIQLPSEIEFKLLQSFGINVNEDNDNIIDTDL